MCAGLQTNTQMHKHIPDIHASILVDVDVLMDMLPYIHIHNFYVPKYTPYVFIVHICTDVQTRVQMCTQTNG
jgi:hypothetical protein